MKDFGNYKILKEIGRGGMAYVFKAEEVSLKRAVAIKVIRNDLTDDKRFVKMFRDEAVIAANLNHPNIVGIYELGMCGDSYYISMEYVKGKSLAEILEKSRSANRVAPLRCALFIVLRVAGALQFAHSRNVIHRDVNPSNILISYEGRVKLADFGIAKAAFLASPHTRVGMLKGKLSYLSPEQVAGQEIDRRTDIFALGITMYELVTGKRLFGGETDFEILEKIRSLDTEKTMSAIGKGTVACPEDLLHIIRKCLHVNRKERYQSLSLLRSDIENVIRKQGLLCSEEDVVSYLAGLFTVQERYSAEERRISAGTEVVPIKNIDEGIKGYKRKGVLIAVSVSAAAIVIFLAYKRVRPLQFTNLSAPSSVSLQKPAIKPAAVKAPRSPAIKGTRKTPVAKTGTSRVTAAARGYQASTGIIYINADPPNAIVWLDNAPKGEGNKTFGNLPIGRHVIKITHPDYEDEIRIIELARDRSIVRLLYRNGEIQIQE